MSSNAISSGDSSLKTRTINKPNLQFLLHFFYY